MGKRLYVGNLPYDADEDAIRAAFSENGGTVERVHIPLDRDTQRPRGFAFLEMSTDEEAQQAIAAMDGASFGSRTLRVSEAEERRPAGGGADLENVMAELHQVQQVNAQLGADLDQARADLNARIERSAPFMNLQRMLQNKNRQVRGLRETLQAHGIHVDDIEATDD